MKAPKKPATRRFPAQNVEHVTPSSQQIARERTNIIPNFRRDIARVGAFAANTTGQIEMPTGNYTYRALFLKLIAPAAIAGETDVRGGRHYVKTAFLSKYIDMISLDLNARAFVELTADEMIRVAAYHRIQNREGVMTWAFGGPGLYEADGAQDAFGLGTSGINSLRIRIGCKAVWVSGMTVEVGAEYFPIARPVGWFVATSRQVFQITAAGNFTLPDLAYGLNWSSMWFKGVNDIRTIKMEIDKRVWIDDDTWTVSALHNAWGKDYDALGGLFLDSNRDGKALAIDALGDTDAEQRRNAEVRADLYVGATGELNVITFHAGLFSDLR